MPRLLGYPLVDVHAAFRTAWGYAISRPGFPSRLRSYVTLDPLKFEQNLYY